MHRGREVLSTFPLHHPPPSLDGIKSSNQEDKPYTPRDPGRGASISEAENNFHGRRNKLDANVVRFRTAAAALGRPSQAGLWISRSARSRSHSAVEHRDGENIVIGCVSSPPLPEMARGGGIARPRMNLFCHPCSPKLATTNAR